MMSVDVKANIKQQEVKDLVAYLTKKYLQNFEIQYKKSVYFSFDFGWYFIHLDSAHEGGWGICLTDKITVLKFCVSDVCNSLAGHSPNSLSTTA